MFWNIAFLTAVTYFFALLSVGRARYLCIWYWFIALPCSQCTNPPITNTHTVWRVTGFRSQLTTYHTTQLECSTVSQNIWRLQIYCTCHTFYMFKVYILLNIKYVFKSACLNMYMQIKVSVCGLAHYLFGFRAFIVWSNLWLLQTYFLKISHTQHIRQNKTGNIFQLIKPSSGPYQEQ
jgi:hypothetical protein